MEVDVVDEEQLRVVHRREQARDFLGERRELLGRGALGREAGRADFEDAPRLVHLLAREAVQRGQKAERLGAERRRAVGNVGARAVPRLHDAHRRQRAQAGAHRRPADADLRRQVALGRQAIAGPQRAALDQCADVRTTCSVLPSLARGRLVDAR